MRTTSKHDQLPMHTLDQEFEAGLCASESMFSRLTRWSIKHQVDQAEMRRLLSVSSLETPLLIGSTDSGRTEPIPDKPVNITPQIPGAAAHPEMLKQRPVLHKLAILLGLGAVEFRHAIGASSTVAQNSVFTSTRELWCCRMCMCIGFHSVYFQYPGAMTCPYHQRPLSRHCSGCARPYEPTIRSVVLSPMACIHCGTSWAILNTGLRNEELKKVIGLVGPMIDNRVKEIAPLPQQLFLQDHSWWWPTPWHPTSQAAALPMQVRRWSLWNDTMKRCRSMHERDVHLDQTRPPSTFDATPLARGALMGGNRSPTCLPVSTVTVERANDALRWLSDACKEHVKGTLRVRGQMGLNPHGRCMNESVDVVSVALHQTMINYGVQRNDLCFLVNYDRDWPHPYHDVRWNHLQLSREGESDGAIDACLVEAEILSWFAITLVRTAMVRFALEVAWPCRLNPWQFVPPYLKTREGTAWIVRYRSRATRESVQRLIKRFGSRMLEPANDWLLRKALHSVRPS